MIGVEQDVLELVLNLTSAHGEPLYEAWDRTVSEDDLRLHLGDDGVALARLLAERGWLEARRPGEYRLAEPGLRALEVVP